MEDSDFDSDSNDYDSIVSSNYSTCSSTDFEFQNLTEEEITKLLKLFRKQLDKNPGIFITPKIKPNIQSVINSDCTIDKQYNKNLNVTIHEKTSFQIPNDIPKFVNSFFGRQTEVKKIDSILNKNKLAVVTGLSGIGKTEFLKHYIENYYGKYEGNIEWLNGITEDKFLDSIKYLCDKYRLNNTVNDLTKYFSQKNLLVIIDNACKNITFRKYFPRSKVTVLIATDNPTFIQEKLILNLSPLTLEESLDLLQNNLEDYFEQFDEKNWFMLVKYFENIPMALQFVSVDIKQKMINNNITVDDYMIVLKQKTRLMCDNPLTVEYEKIYFSFRLLTEQLIISEKEYILVLDILNICIYFNEDIINNQLLLNQKSILISKDELNEVLNVLIKYKLINTIMKQNIQEIHIHNLIRRMLFHEQKINKKHHFYFKMALGVPTALSALNIKHILNFAVEMTDTFVDYFFQQNLTQLFEPIVKYGYKSILQQILLLSSDPIELIREHKLLEIAINSEQKEVIKLLIEFQADLNAIHALNLAAKKFNIVIIIILLQSGANIQDKDENNRTPLHMTAGAQSPLEKEEKAVQCARELVRNGVNVRAEDKFGLTALHYAFKNKLFKLVSFLLKIGGVYNFYIHNPLKHVFEWKILKEKEENLALKAIKDLLFKGADKTVKDTEGRNLLHWAIEIKSFEITQFLVKDCAIDINEQDNYGRTVLHKILDQIISTKTESRFFVNIVKLLTANGAKTDIRDLEGKTAYDIGSRRGNVKMNLLIQFLSNEIPEKKKHDNCLAFQQRSNLKQNSKKSKHKAKNPTYFWNTDPYRQQSCYAKEPIIVPPPSTITYANYIGVSPVQSSIPGPSYNLLN